MDYTLITEIAAEAIRKMNEILGFESTLVKVVVRPDGTVRVSCWILGL